MSPPEYETLGYQDYYNGFMFDEHPGQATAQERADWQTGWRRAEVEDQPQ